MTSFEKRMVDVNFARHLRGVVLQAERKGWLTEQELKRFRDLAEHQHRKVCVDGCSFDEYLARGGDAYPGCVAATTLVELPIENTPAERPRAKLRHASRTWLQRLIDRVRR